MSYIKFDRRGPARVENDLYTGVVIDRGIQVYDFPIHNLTGGNSDPQVLLRCLGMLGSGAGDYVNRFPQLNDPYPPPNSGSGDPNFSFCTVVHQQITGLDKSNRVVEAMIRYHSPLGPQSVGVITYTVSDTNQQAYIRTEMTADGSEVISGWYQPGYNNQYHWAAPGSPNPPLPAIQHATVLSPGSQKLITYRVIEATAQAFKSDWEAVKPAFEAIRGHINSNTTGDWAPRGTWLYAGPSMQYSNAGTTGTIRHVFLEGVGATRWFPLFPFRDRNNEHPPDAATELDLSLATLSPGYPPPVGTQIRINGLTMASVYLEANFSSIFPSIIHP